MNREYLGIFIHCPDIFAGSSENSDSPASNRRTKWLTRWNCEIFRRWHLNQRALITWLFYSSKFFGGGLTSSFIDRIWPVWWAFHTSLPKARCFGADRHDAELSGTRRKVKNHTTKSFRPTTNELTYLQGGWEKKRKSKKKVELEK